jgi:hypothetical protein
MRGSSAVSSRRIETGSLPVACATSSRKLSIAKAFGALPTPRSAAPIARRAFDDLLSALVRDAVHRNGRAFHAIRSVFGGVAPRAARHVGGHRLGNDAVMQATILPLASRPASMYCVRASKPSASKLQDHSLE